MKASAPANHGRWSALALPAIIAMAAIVTLLQVPLLFKTQSGGDPAVTRKSDLSAKTLAEAGIEAAIADIGRKRIRLSAQTDTTPYIGVGLGRGRYTTRIKADSGQSDRMEVMSTGSLGADRQSVRAVLELVKTRMTIPFDTPAATIWGIRGTPPALYYHSLAERDAGLAWIHPEGPLDFAGGGIPAIDDLTIAPDGTLYFINNAPGSGGALYRIRPEDLDRNPATPVAARMVGPTGLGVGTRDEIRGLSFIAGDAGSGNGVLYAVTWKSGKIFELSLENGAASLASQFAPAGPGAGGEFRCEAMTHDSAGIVYLLRDNAGSEIWKFPAWPALRTTYVTYVADLSGPGRAVRSLAGHPDGSLYAADGAHWLRINPPAIQARPRAARIVADNAELRGMAFHFEREHLKLTGRRAPRKTSLCHYPPGDCGNAHTIQVDQAALASHLRHDGAHGCRRDTPGPCPGTAIIAAPEDTAVQVRIISWEAVSGKLAANR